MTESTPKPLDLSAKMHFHMVLADVVFETKRGGVSSHRTQIMTQSDLLEFPAARIHQLQNSAAHTIKEKLGSGRSEGFKVHDVLFLNMHYCGHLTHEQFYGKGMTAPAELSQVDTSSVADNETPSVSTGETGSDNNVVPLKRD